MSILLEKQEKALRLLNNLAEKKRIQIKEIQTLTGYLNFLTKVIFTGCTFTCRMYTKYANLQDAKSGNKLKPHYHIRVDGEFRLDCEIWRIFLTHHRVRAVCRPMVDLDATTSAKQLKFFLDASANPKLGMGAVFKTNGFILNGNWDTSWKMDQESNIWNYWHSPQLSLHGGNSCAISTL